MYHPRWPYYLASHAIDLVCHIRQGFKGRFGKIITLAKEPTENLELGNGIVLSISNQKFLKEHVVMHTKKYALFYFEYADGGDLYVCRKKYGK